MLEFLLLTAIATALMVWSVARLLTDRFPSPADLAALSTYYYSAPLAIAAFFNINPEMIVFLHAPASDAGLGLQSMRFVVAAMVALQLGSYAARWLGAPKLNAYFEIGAASVVRAQAGYAAFFAVIGLGILLFGWDAFLQGYATSSFSDTADLGNALVYFASGSLGILLAYSLLIQRLTPARDQWVLVAAAIALALVVLVVRGKRLEIVSAFLPVAVVMLGLQRERAGRGWRRLGWGGAAVAVLIVIAFARIEGGQVNPFMTIFYFLSEGLYAGHSLPGLISRLESNLLDYEYGSRFVTALFGFIPGFLWSGKNDLVYAGNQALLGLSPLGATTLLAEVVLQGGFWAVLICYTTMGFVLRRIDRFADVWDAALSSRKIPLRFLAYLIALAIFVPHFRDGIIPAVKLSLQAIVFGLVLFGWQRRSAALRLKHA